jgi:hypothetical protein
MKMNKKSVGNKDSAEKLMKNIRRKTERPNRSRKPSECGIE